MAFGLTRVRLNSTYTTDKPVTLGFWIELKWKNHQNKDENQQQTFDPKSGIRIRDLLVEGECPHHCAIPNCRHFALSRE